MNLDDDQTEVVETEALEPEAKQEAIEQAEEALEPEAFGFADEAEPAAEEQAPDLVSKLRKELRERDRKLAELTKAQAAKEEPAIGPKPTMDSCGWDEEEFERQIDAWKGKQSEQQRKADEAKRAQESQQQAWVKRVQDFESKAKELRIPDFDQAVSEVSDEFGDDQAGQVAKAILIVANDPRLIAALRASPTKMQQLVALKGDPTALAIAVGEMKGKITAMPSRKAPDPEKIARGNSPSAAPVDKHLERLEAEAGRTGDRTQVIRYKQSLRDKQK